MTPDRYHDCGHKLRDGSRTSRKNALSWVWETILKSIAPKFPPFEKPLALLLHFDRFAEGCNWTQAKGIKVAGVLLTDGRYWNVKLRCVCSWPDLRWKGGEILRDFKDLERFAKTFL